MKLFADNIGVVSIHEKEVAIPSNIEVVMQGNSSASKGLGDGFSCFITKFTSQKKSRYQTKTSLLQKTHIIPFGETPEIIQLSGITFGFTQINSEGKGGSGKSVGETGGKGVTEYRVDTPYDVKTVEEEPPQATAPSSDGSEEGSQEVITTDEEDKNLLEKVTSWVVGVKDAVAEKRDDLLGAIRENSVVQKVGDLASKGLSAVQKAASVVNSVLALPGQIVSSIAGGLLGNVAEADEQLTRREGYNSQFFPLSFPEINLLFHRLHAGSSRRVFNKEKIKVSYCGVLYLCAIDSVTFSSDQASNVITFNMTLICLEASQYYSAIQGTSAGTTVVNTRGEAPTLLMQAGQALGSAAMSKIRSVNPTIGNISIGRLLG